MASQLKSLPVAKKLKKVRKMFGVNQKEMGEIIGVNQSQYSKYERGRQPLTVCQLLHFAEWFNLHPCEFFTNKQKKRELMETYR